MNALDFNTFPNTDDLVQRAYYTEFFTLSDEASKSLTPLFAEFGEDKVLKEVREHFKQPVPHHTVVDHPLAQRSAISRSPDEAEAFDRAIEDEARRGRLAKWRTASLLWRVHSNQLYSFGDYKNISEYGKTHHEWSTTQTYLYINLYGFYRHQWHLENDQELWAMLMGARNLQSLGDVASSSDERYGEARLVQTKSDMREWLGLATSLRYKPDFREVLREARLERGISEPYQTTNEYQRELVHENVTVYDISQSDPMNLFKKDGQMIFSIEDNIRIIIQKV